MGRNKHIKYEVVKKLPNVVITEIYDNRIIDFEKCWDKETYKDREVVLELGCGDGEYSLNMAKKNPYKIFVGVDMRSNRLCVGAIKAIENNLTNIVFLRTLIERLGDFFHNHSVSEIWIPFPDPHATKKNRNKRLTSMRFLELYKQILKPGGIIRLITDNTGLYEFSLESITDDDAEIHVNTDNLYHSSVTSEDVLSVKSRYEKKFLPVEKTIKYLEFSYP